MDATLPRKALFDIPNGVIYLDGNSLGPLPKAVPAQVEKAMQSEWGGQLIKGWNTCGWMAQPGLVGNRTARLIGADDGSVMMGDTLSIKVFQALAAALKLRPDRRVILSDSGNFPSDLYMAEGLIDTVANDYDLKIVAPDKVRGAIDDTVAVVMLTHVDYRSGRMHDMAGLTKAAHRAGAVMLWDLAHSAGAVPVDLTACQAEFAVGCTYKYLNGGPGAPAFIYVRPDLIETVEPALAGWLGHDRPFAFEQGYRPAPSIDRMRVGTPPVLQMTALEAALTVWDDVDMADVRIQSITLADLFIREVEAHCPTLRLASPRNAAERGSQVSFAHPDGYAIMQALIARGVIGDFRAPDLIRFGITPLYLDKDDILAAVGILRQILDSDAWKDPEYQKKQAVT
ncbi:Kynureninase [Cognatiyoonia koreensis]|uniref:Kynureninase n=1 Tax=Cognatiyoonia koreensis TaxID=364200 RepID=A0A1I0PW98_9RHOB|nr:kynureninase [Cognatiyoonia koreensis]SEW18666.1 Kynureninase [Cognatiyoonia koreensis]